MRPDAAPKLCALEELAARVPDGASITFGGVFLHRGPFAFVRELVRQGRRNLEVIKASPAYDLDLLCRAKAVAKVRAGIVAMEANFGLAPWFRTAIERKEIVLEEHA
jgi:glutaconate CoA-transferase subunit A